VLNPNQIKFLAKWAGMKLIYIDDVPVSISRTIDKPLRCSYEAFKEGMGLEDIRLHWLLGRNNMLAGGSVLNWVWGEAKHEDIDFFFKGAESVEVFGLFIQTIGFVSTRVTHYAETYFHPEEGLIIQTVGGVDKSRDFRAYGEPAEVIASFDMYVCKFAVDADYVYASTRAIQDLLKLTLATTGFEKEYFLPRYMKYVKKGFFPCSKIHQAMRYEPNKNKTK